ncbi:MAG: 2Fe-2S iron-sulfur cluster-binding protein, partial [Pseudomonadota bacterium]
MTRRSIRFVLDGRVVTLDNVPATRTVLEYLREDRQRTGTKEGCAEGDCGACMVAVGTLEGDGVCFRPINACIQFLVALDGKALVTVESLAAGGTLHPAQHAMIDCHGSQCGFCTPGFVMTLFALHATADTAPARTDIDDALAGNLCRCTGYRPIVDAAETMFAATDWTPPWGSDAALAEQLRDIAPTDTLVVDAPTGRLIAPASVDALAAAYLAEPDATLVAGSTDVGLWVTKQYRELGTIIAIADVPELRTLTVSAAGITAGATVTLADLMPPLTALYPAFTSML